ncbi:hypothetical protein ACOXXX_15265 [Thalassococcus sp. BH17M4-6]|uniref:hypothetical protein n=1 Tax=Thalassococcus sp. BH17M4-6 TaxID=3413148 RepID=UPI003BBCD74C
MRTPLVLALFLAGCGGLPSLGGLGGGGGPRADGSIVVEDAVGAKLVVDRNGCQSVVPASGGPAEPVLDADGAPVCLNE